MKWDTLMRDNSYQSLRSEISLYSTATRRPLC